MKLITYSLIGIALVGQQAVAEEKTIQNFDDKTWYFSAGYSTSLWSSDKWHDPSTGGSTINSHQNTKFKDLNSYSIGLGKQYEDWGFEISYEDLGRIKWTVGRSTQINGTVAQSGQANFKTKNLMLSANRDLWESDNSEIYATFGIGKGEHYNDTAYLVVSGTTVEYANPLTTDVTTYRAGLGYRRNLSSRVVLDSRITFSDYGKAFVWDNVGNTKTYRVTIQSLDIGVGLRYLF